MRKFRYYWAEGFRNIVRHGFSSFAAVAIILVCLLLTGTVALIAYNINLCIINLQQNSEIVAYAESDLTTREAQALEEALASIDNVATVTFQSRDEALESYRIELGEDADLLDDFDSANNPLPNSFHLTFQDATRADETITAVENVEGIDSIRADEATINKLIRVQRVFNIVALAMVIGLAFISIFIIANTVKLAMFARRDEIAIQKMVGATNWFIRWPFLIEGLVLGIVAGGLAFLAEWGAYQEIANIASGVIPSFTMLPFEQIRYLVLEVYCGAGALFGIGGSFMSIRRYMNV